MFGLSFWCLLCSTCGLVNSVVLDSSLLSWWFELVCICLLFGCLLLLVCVGGWVFVAWLFTW